MININDSYRISTIVWIHRKHPIGTLEKYSGGLNQDQYPNHGAKWLEDGEFETIRKSLRGRVRNELKASGLDSWSKS